MPTVASNLSEYTSFDSRIQHNSDTWSYDAAHPDHTIVLAGPPRYSSVGELSEGSTNLFTLGALQSIVVSSAKPWQPYQPIGQISTSFLGGKTQNQAQISRLMINSKNLNASLYANINSKTINANFNNADTNNQYFGSNENYWVNLDNPLYHVPFGLACLFRTKNQNTIGGFYMELALIQSFQAQVQMGQAMILENVGLIFDRMLPLLFKEVAVPFATLGDNYPA